MIADKKIVLDMLVKMGVKPLSSLKWVAIATQLPTQ